MKKKTLTFSLLLAITALLAACQSSTVTPESNSTLQALPSGTPVSTQAPSPTAEVTNAPSPEATVTSWEQLIDPDLIANENWTLYTGQIQGAEKDKTRTFTLSYPSQWVLTSNPSPVHFYVQNTPETVGGGPAAGDFVKLELVFLDAPLVENSNGEKYLVSLDGEDVTLQKSVSAVGQALTLGVTLPKDGALYHLAGYANLKEPDQAALDRYQAILLSMMSSFQLQE